MSSTPWPLFDLFLDLPHPAASPSCPGPFSIGAPSANHGESSKIQQELGDAAVIYDIARFAFPEYDQPPPALPPTSHGAGLNRYDVYMTGRWGFQEHAFSLQLSSGQRVHGHVRRYLPTHLQASSRYDVGRRGVRAMVLLTRASGGDFLYSALLKTVEAISSMQAALSPALHPHAKPQEHFLFSSCKYHEHLSRVYAQKPHDQRRPMLMTIEGLETGGPPNGLYATVDTSRFLIPLSLLQPPSKLSPTSSSTEAPILPVLRCLGIPNTLRLLSALLSERRVILISNSPTRLSNCARSLLSILGQGLLHWQHIYVPVLPPHHFDYLDAPHPYLMGTLSTLKLQEHLQRQELGEVLLIYLDTNALETRGIPTPEIAMRIPDLFQSSLRNDALTNPGVQPATSPPELLANDLTDILKSDKKIMTGDSPMQSVGETAAKATKAVKSAFGKLRSKGKQYLQQRSSASDYETSTPPPETSTPPSERAVTADEIYAEGCQNPIGEEEACIAFTAFFLTLYGDLRWYLGAPGADGVPQFDRSRFLQQKRAMGEGEGTSIFPLLQNMCHSQMFEQFVKERVEEIRTRTPVTKDSPLFLTCTNYLRSQQAVFNAITVRNVSRQMAQANPTRAVTEANANARRLAMTLTSNKTFEGNQGQAIAQLVEVARESSSVLFDVMSVLWMRISDSKGMQWKHGLQALLIMKNLLYHGPLAAVAGATDGLDKIRAMKAYNEPMRQQPSKQIQAAAADIYILLVDRVKLFSIRRVCADRRRKLKTPSQARLIKDTRMRVSAPFKSLHAALHPNARRQVAPAPGGRPTGPVTQSPAQPVNDLLGFSGGPAQSGPPAGPSPATALAPPSSQTELLGLFNAQTQISRAPVAHDPFAAAPTPPRPGTATPPRPAASASASPHAPAPRQQASPQSTAPPFGSPATQVPGRPQPAAPQSYGPQQSPVRPVTASHRQHHPPPQMLQQHPQQNQAPPASHPQAGYSAAPPPTGYAPQQQPPGPVQYQTGFQSPPPQTGYQMQQMPPGHQQRAPYPGQPPPQRQNPFAAQPQQLPKQQPQRNTLSKFDPMAR